MRRTSLLLPCFTVSYLHCSQLRLGVKHWVFSSIDADPVSGHDDGPTTETKARRLVESMAMALSPVASLTSTIKSPVEALLQIGLDLPLVERMYFLDPDHSHNTPANQFGFSPAYHAYTQRPGYVIRTQLPHMVVGFGFFNLAFNVLRRQCHAAGFLSSLSSLLVPKPPLCFHSCII